MYKNPTQQVVILQSDIAHSSQQSVLPLLSLLCILCYAVTFVCRVWSSVRSSVLHSLWSSPAGDVIEQQLSLPSHMSQGHNLSRAQRLQLYARALNNSFCEVGGRGAGATYMCELLHVCLWWFACCQLVAVALLACRLVGVNGSREAASYGVQQQLECDQGTGSQGRGGRIRLRVDRCCCWLQVAVTAYAGVCESTEQQLEQTADALSKV
jgi:hypothetical protein